MSRQGKDEEQANLQPHVSFYMLISVSMREHIRSEDEREEEGNRTSVWELAGEIAPVFTAKKSKRDQRLGLSLCLCE